MNTACRWRDLQQKTVDAGGPLPPEDNWATHVDYGVNLVGEDYIGIGLDMAAGGANIRDFDATSYPRLTEALVEKGYAPSRVRKILGENWLRVLDGAQGIRRNDPENGRLRKHAFLRTLPSMSRI